MPAGHRPRGYPCAGRLGAASQSSAGISNRESRVRPAGGRHCPGSPGRPARLPQLVGHPAAPRVGRGQRVARRQVDLPDRSRRCGPTLVRTWAVPDLPLRYRCGRTAAGSVLLVVGPATRGILPDHRQALPAAGRFAAIATRTRQPSFARPAGGRPAVGKRAAGRFLPRPASPSSFGADRRRHWCDTVGQHARVAGLLRRPPRGLLLLWCTKQHRASATRPAR